jgi:hypothetical protein
LVNSQHMKTVHNYQDINSSLHSTKTPHESYIQPNKINLDLENYQRGKPGIKLISSITTRNNNKNIENGKYFEDAFLQNNYSNNIIQTSINQQGSKSIVLGGQKIERGYETLR